MKKIFWIFIFFIIFLLITTYTILFTNFGNKIVSNYFEKKVNYEQSELKFEIKEFKLTTNYISFDAWVNDNSEIKISGEFSFLKKEFDLLYLINIYDLSILKNLISYDIKGSLCTNGTFIGNKQESFIQGVSNIAKSQTKYYFSLKNFYPKNFNIQVKNAKIEELLLLLGKPNYAKGDLNLTADVKDTKKSALEGMVISTITNGKVNNDIVNDELKLGLANIINFKANSEAFLSANNIQIKSNINSSVGEIIIDKMIVDFLTNKINLDYKIDIKNINIFSGLIGNELVGEFTTNGKVEVLNKNTQIEGVSNIFESDTKYKAKLNNLELYSTSFSIENGRIEKLLKMLSEPIYVTGNVNIKGDIRNTNINKLDGTINSNFSDISIVKEVANAVFNQNIKEEILSNLEINTKLIPNQALSKIILQTNIGNLTTQNSIYDFKLQTFTSDYLLNISSLERIKDFTKIKLFGSIDLSGSVFSEENKFLLKGKANALDGIFNFNLEKDNLNLDLDDISIKELSKMLHYPEIFDSKGNLNITYDFLTKKGDLTGKLINGYFLSNAFTTLLNPLLKTDLTKEFYKSINVNGKIEDGVLTSDLIIENQNTHFEIKNSILDFNNNFIDTKIQNKYFHINIYGELPFVKVFLNK
jgi:hypothetical protein